MGDAIERLFQKRYWDRHRARPTSIKPQLDKSPALAFTKRQTSPRTPQSPRSPPKHLLSLDAIDDSESTDSNPDLVELCHACLIIRETNESLKRDREILQVPWRRYHLATECGGRGGGMDARRRRGGGWRNGVSCWAFCFV